MTAFEKISQLQCPKCGRRGVATWEKNTSPLNRGSRVLEDLSDGFVAIDVGAKEGARIQCAKCRITVGEE